jgi:predicted tellurium resistance membrane protein TerC
MPVKKLLPAIGMIIIADVSMSLDNVLAVAGIARHNPFIMTLGLIVSIACVAYASKIVSELLDKFKWLNWVGVGLITMVALELVLGIQAV